MCAPCARRRLESRLGVTPLAWSDDAGPLGGGRREPRPGEVPLDGTQRESPRAFATALRSRQAGCEGNTGGRPMVRGIVASLLVTVLTATPVLARNAAGRAARAAGPAKAVNPARVANARSGSSKSSGSASRGQNKLGSS